MNTYETEKQQNETLREGERMDLLKMGMEYADSSSKVKRAAAQVMLEAVKKKADWYEAFVMRQNITMPNEMQSDAAMLEKIKEKIAAAQQRE